MALSSAARQRNYRARRKQGDVTFSRADRDAVVELLESLPRIAPSHEGTYTYTDRARDFLTVFGSEPGRRVLSQISQLCDPPPTLRDADNHGTLAFHSGMRRVFREIMLCMVAKEPITIERTNDVGS